MYKDAGSRVWKWRAAVYDVCEGSHLRRAPVKTDLFRNMRGRVLFVSVGTGIDITCFPPGADIVAIDISSEMLRRAQPRREQYQGDLRFVRTDAESLCFDDRSFDCAVTSCTLCSVPDPVRALREIRRVLKPGAPLFMFEHVRSQIPLFGWTLDLMTLWTRLFGTEMNRDTLSNARAAGLRIVAVESVFLDIILAVRAVKPLEHGPADEVGGPSKRVANSIREVSDKYRPKRGTAQDRGTTRTAVGRKSGGERPSAYNS